MIVVDTSALMAILNGEPEAEEFSRLMTEDSDVVLAAPNLLEFMIVSIRRRGDGQRPRSQALIDKFVPNILPWSAEMAELATTAFVRFGKSRHPASLNFGDCVAYALAKSLDAPLLFKGNDFALTDIESAAG